MTTERKSTDEYVQLSRFVGRWNTEGKILATNTTPEVKIIGTDIYEWLPGEYFLLHKVEVWVVDDKMKLLKWSALTNGLENIRCSTMTTKAIRVV